jgi:hypothetical protein
MDCHAAALGQADAPLNHWFPAMAGRAAKNAAKRVESVPAPVHFMFAEAAHIGYISRR